MLYVINKNAVVQCIQPTGQFYEQKHGNVAWKDCRLLAIPQNCILCIVMYIPCLNLQVAWDSFK